MLENIGLSFKGIWAHKMRSFLTMLGIIIGIASIITIVSSIKGTNEQIKKNLIGSGNNTVTVDLYQGDWVLDKEYSAIPAGVPVITQNMIDEIAALDGIESVSAYVYRNEYDGVYNGTISLSGGMVTGIDKNYFNVYGYSIQKGRGFTESDFTDSKKVAILDPTSSSGLFQGEDPLGKTIELKGEPYVVIGVADLSSAFEPVINSIEDYYTYHTDYTSGKVFIPDTTWPIIYRYDEPQSIVIRAKSTDHMTNSGKATADLLNSYLTVSDENIKYKATDLLEQATQIQELSASANQQLLWIASISLLVGGIGVMNIMLVSVTERTREIGLKKALGARKRRILFQFLTEAAVLTSIGGLMGVACGIGLAYAFSSLTTAPVAISIPAIIISVAFSMVIGIIFGIIPSIKAANLNPIDALRYE